MCSLIESLLTRMPERRTYLHDTRKLFELFHILLLFLVVFPRSGCALTARSLRKRWWNRIRKSRSLCFGSLSDTRRTPGHLARKAVLSDLRTRNFGMTVHTRRKLERAVTMYYPIFADTSSEFNAVNVLHLKSSGGYRKS